MSPASPALLRRLAALLIRGPEAPYVLTDLDDAFDRDIARALPRWRVQSRYLVNVVLSAVSLAAAGVRRSSFKVSFIDIRLGLRMLVKFPMLTAVALFALTIGIPVALAPMHVVNVLERPLPEDPEGRIQVLRYWRESTTFADLTRWQASLTSFDVLAGTRTTEYNVGDGDSDSTVTGAEITASTFDVLGVRPVLGRAFESQDEVPGSPAVVIIGYDLWQTTFGERPDLAGQTLRIGGVPHDVIGVMPKGFMFPARHRLWLPVRDRHSPDREQARQITIFGRLAPGVTPDAAQVEFSAVAAETTLPDERLVPEVVSTAALFVGFPKGGLRSTPDFFIAQILTLVPLFVACINVGLLTFARSATRSSEFAVRTALGASRSRILTQVFTEALVLATLATGAGLMLLNWLPGRLLAELGIALPYWMDTTLDRATILSAVAVGGLSALVAGVIPVLRTTGRSISHTIQRTHAQRSGVRFGGLTSVLIVADVAVAVVVVGFATAVADRTRATMANEAHDGIRAERYLAFELRRPMVTSVPDADSNDRQTVDARMAATQQALVDRLKSEPGVRAVAVGSALPRMDHRLRRIELEEGEERFSKATTADVSLDFFEELRQPVLVGRAFDAGDLLPDSRAVIVNTSFVANVLGHANPIGRRVRFLAWDDASAPGPWYEIVGVVGHLGMHSLNPTQDEGIYRPLVPGTLQPVRIAVELDDDPMTFAPRLRDLAREVDAHAVVSATTSLDRTFEGDWYIMAAAVGGGIVLVAVLLTLAASGIYAIMSFTVAQRTREIGIRMALGADRTQVVLHVAKRALIQIAIGVVLGMTIAGSIFFELQRDANPDGSALVAGLVSLLPGIAIMAAIGLVSCAAPTLRALRISPVEALRGDH